MKYLPARHIILILRHRMQATIMTDPGMADRTYIGPMTPELVEQILAKVIFQLP